MKIPESPPDAADVLGGIRDDPAALLRIIQAPVGAVDGRGRYLHWDDMRARTPTGGLSRPEWWFAIASARQTIARELPLRAVDGRPFWYCNIDHVQERVHHIDQRASGQILADDVVTSLRGSNRYLVSSLIEEAITSSQLEGASTTRRVAKEMLVSGRKPRTHSEKMIANNYTAMLLAQELEDEELSPDDVLALHLRVSEGTLGSPDAAGRLQRPDEDRIGVYWHDDTLLHRPPPAEVLPARLEAMCRFANGDTPEGFLHPVLRAIVLHFWLAYDHPFEDGNGRTARALFYWCMLHNGYWLAQYLSVSSILHKAPAQYARSFLKVETDNCDLTYFLIYQLDVIDRAIRSLHDYLALKIAENQEVDKLMRGSRLLNHRQIPVMHEALRDPGEAFTFAAQARRNRVTHQTARTDLLELERLGLLDRGMNGRQFVFRAPRDLAARLRKLGAASA